MKPYTTYELKLMYESLSKGNKKLVSEVTERLWGAEQIARLAERQDKDGSTPDGKETRVIQHEG